MHITGRTATDGARTGRLAEHRVDHANDAETEGVLRAVIAAEGRLDVLVNNAWPGYEHMVEGDRFTWTDPGVGAADVARVAHKAFFSAVLPA